MFALLVVEKAFAVLSSFMCPKTSFVRISLNTTVNTVDLNSKYPKHLRVGELSAMIQSLIKKKLIPIIEGSNYKLHSSLERGRCSTWVT